ncbi:hypothetical protein WJX82_005324 [Trebouxia sp. C0006]
MAQAPIPVSNKMILSYNRLIGSLPTAWAGAQWQRLNLTNNQLNGSLLPLCNISELQFIYLSHNNFSGTIPDLLWDDTIYLYDVDLELDYNQLTGTLPNWPVPNWPVEIFILKVSQNNMWGPLPEWCTHVSAILAANNQFTGTLPSFAASAMDFSSNRLHGALPDSWNETSVQLCNLGSNNFSSSLPPSWGSWHAANAILLNNNSLTGTIPATWHRMIELQQLNLASNKLTFGLGQVKQYGSAASG